MNSKYCNYLLYLGVFFIPIYIKLATIFFASYLLLIIIFRRCKGKVLYSELAKKFLLTILFYYALLIVGLIYTENMQEGLFQLEVKLLILFCPLVFFIYSPSIDVERVLLVQVVSATLAQLILFFTFINEISFQLQNFYKVFFYDYGYHNYASYLRIHPSYFSVYILISVFALVGFFFKAEGYLKKAVVGLILLFCILNLIILASRMAIISLIIWLPFAFVFFNKSIDFKKIAFGLLTPTIFIVFAVFFSPMLRDRFINDVKLDLGFSFSSEVGEKNIKGNSRVERWFAITDRILQKPVFGYGTGDSQEQVILAYQSKGFDYAIASNYNPHNQFISDWLRIGLLGIGSLLLMFIIQLMIALKNFSYVYIGFLFTFFIFFCVENVLDRQHGVFVFVLFSCIFSTMPPNNRS